MDAFEAKALRLASESRSTQAAAQQVGIRPQLLYRWQQAQLMAEVGSVEAARAPEARPAEAGRARARHFKKPLGILGQPTRCALTATSLSAKRQSPCASSARRCVYRRARTMPGSAASYLLRSQRGKWLFVRILGGMLPVTAPAVCGPSCTPRAT